MQCRIIVANRDSVFFFFFCDLRYLLQHESGGFLDRICFQVIQLSLQSRVLWLACHQVMISDYKGMKQSVK
jgi:hypothetical protein